jgi:hypothetical protein
MLIRTTPFWHLFGPSLLRAPESEGGTAADAEAPAPEGEAEAPAAEEPAEEVAAAEPAEEEAPREAAEPEGETPNVPDDPSGYDLSVQADLDGLDLPADYKPEVDPDDPAVKDLTRFAHSQGLSQEVVTGILGIAARMFATEVAADHAAISEEKSKLGPNSESRIKNIETALTNRVKDEGARKALAAMMTSADAIRGVEALLGSGTTKTAGTKATPDYGNMGAFDRLRAITVNRASGRAS